MNTLKVKLKFKNKMNHIYSLFKKAKREDSAPKTCLELETQKTIIECGYECETHKVTTTDNYILTLFRVLPREETAKHKRARKKKPPVILLHGIYCDSSTWVCNRNPNNLCFMLVNAGYDLWLCDSRGAGDSKSHVHLNPDESKSYWRFSFQDMAEHDFPAVIKYVLKESKKPKVHYIGHSQGTLIAFAGLSHNKLLNKKLASFHALAPVFSVKYLPEHMKLLAKVLNSHALPTSLMKDMQLNPSSLLYKTLFAEFSSGNHLVDIDPRNRIFEMLGMHPDRYMDGTKNSCFSTRSGITFRNLMHMSQVAMAGTVRKYDYGKDENLKLYGSETPPEYDVTKTTIPTALYFGSDDLLTHEKDQEYLIDNLPNVVHNQLIKNFDHFDFMWGVNAPIEVFKVLIENLEKIEKGKLINKSASKSGR